MSPIATTPQGRPIGQTEGPVSCCNGGIGSGQKVKCLAATLKLKV